MQQYTIYITLVLLSLSEKGSSFCSLFPKFFNSNHLLGVEIGAIILPRSHIPTSKNTLTIIKYFKSRLPNIPARTEPEYFANVFYSDHPNSYVDSCVT